MLVVDCRKFSGHWGQIPRTHIAAAGPELPSRTAHHEQFSSTRYIRPGCGNAAWPFLLSKSSSAALQDGGTSSLGQAPHPPTEMSSVVRRLVAVMSVIFASLVAGCAGGQPAAETPTTLGAPTSSASFSPASQREVQDHVIELFQRTVNALPAGTAADSSRFGGWGTTVPCDDKATSKDAPANYSDSRDLKLPPGSDYNAAVAHVGDIWTSSGWRVFEREDVRSPTGSPRHRMPSSCRSSSTTPTTRQSSRLVRPASAEDLSIGMCPCRP